MYFADACASAYLDEPQNKAAEQSNKPKPQSQPQQQAQRQPQRKPISHLPALGFPPMDRQTTPSGATRPAMAARAASTGVFGFLTPLTRSQQQAKSVPNSAPNSAPPSPPSSPVPTQHTTPPKRLSELPRPKATWAGPSEGEVVSLIRFSIHR